VNRVARRKHIVDGATLVIIVLPINHLARALCVFSVFTAGLFAHDFYILPDAFSVTPKSTVRLGFHNGDSFPESEVSPTIARVKDAQLVTAGGAVPIQNIQVSGKRAIGTVLVPEGVGNFLLSVHTAPNFIELAPDKFLAYLKEEGLANVINWRREHRDTAKPGRERYSKFAKSLLVSGAPNDFYKHTVGFPIEIVPEANPYTLHAGSQLPVRIMFRGEPAAGLQLETAWSGEGKSKTTVIGRTDSAGRITVPLSAAGKWRLHSLMMERYAESATADWESFWASLTFEIR
jgi:uncharacterized GH25 family protein